MAKKSDPDGFYLQTPDGVSVTVSVKIQNIEQIDKTS
jgi:hypothetical protein